MTPFAKHQPSGITIHHSLTKDSKSLSLTPIDRHHEEVCKMDDIGYHEVVELVFDEVKIMSGRSSAYQGAHCPDLNATHLGVCLVGNYDEEIPSEGMFHALVRCCVSIMIRNPRIRPQDINFHSDYSSKTCPGKMFPKTAFLLAVSDRAQALGLHLGAL